MKLNPQKINVFILHSIIPKQENNLQDFRNANFYVYFQDDKIKTSSDFRGTHSKFWVYPNNSLPHLCKFSNSRYSTVGELIAQRALDSISYPHAKYFPLVIRVNNGFAYGTASPDILTGRTQKEKSGQFEEISARSLASKYLNTIHDTNYGMQVPYEHTVDFYLKALKEVEKCNDKELKQIKTELLKVALIQAMFLMNDLHEENLGFFKDKQTGKISIMPLYDYGSCLQLDWNYATTLNKIDNFKPSRIKDTDLFEQKVFNKIAVNKKNSLIFGVHTPLMEASTDIRTITNTRKNILRLDSIQIVLNELAQEMQNNKELSEFYTNLKNGIKFGAISQYYKDCIDPITNQPLIPELYYDIAEQTFNITTKMMDKTIQNVQSTKKNSTPSNTKQNYEQVKCM